MRQKPTLEQEAKFFDAIKNGGKSFSELEKMGLPKKTVDRYIKRYIAVKVIYKDPTDGRYYWGECPQPGASDNYILHSKSLIPYFRGLPYLGLYIDKSGNLGIFTKEQLLPNQADTPGPMKEPTGIESRESTIIEAIFQHLNSGYPRLSECLGEIKTLQDKIMSELENAGYGIGTTVVDDSYTIDPKFEAIFQPLQRLRIECVGKFAILEAQLNYDPSRLKGRCFICKPTKEE